MASTGNAQLIKLDYSNIKPSESSATITVTWAYKDNVTVIYIEQAADTHYDDWNTIPTAIGSGPSPSFDEM